jgi:hypothetical protein
VVADEFPHAGIRGASAIGDAKVAKLPTAGDVIVAGGANGKKTSIKAEFYNPTTKKFVATGSSTLDRFAPCGAILTGASAKVLMAGGAQGSTKGMSPATITLKVMTQAEEYDPTTGTFAATSEMAASRWAVPRRCSTTGRC